MLLDLADAGLTVTSAAKAVSPDLARHIPRDIATPCAGAVWDAFLDGLHTWALLVGAFGLILAAAATSVFRPMDAASPVQRAWAVITHVPISTVGRLARAAAALAFGVLLLLEPADALEVAVTIAGAYAIYFACTEIVGLIERASDEDPRAVA